MATSLFENDEPIHHSVGKDHQESCPVSDKQSLSVSKPPPGTKSRKSFHKSKRQCKVKRFISRIIRSYKLSVHQEKNVHYHIDHLTIEVSDDFINKQTHDFMIKNFNAYYCVFMNVDNHNNGSNSRSKESNDAESVDYEEVNPKPKQSETFVSKQHLLSCRDYSKSPLIPLLTYPKHALYFIDWLHRNMDNQTSPREIIKPLRAACERGLFKSSIPYDIFVEEFGGKVAQPWYSKLMNERDRYQADELSLALETLNMNLFRA